MTEDDTPVADSEARARWIALQLMRVSGAALVMFGAIIAVGRTSLPPVAGTVLMLVGLLDATVMPLVFARRWRSPRQ